MDYDILIGFILATAALAISPGPDNIFVLTLSMANGKKYGLAVVAGLMTGCLVHTTLLAFGVSEIIKRSDTLFWTIKLFGALYLLYLAFMVFREGSGIELSKGATTTLKVRGLFKKGFWMIRFVSKKSWSLIIWFIWLFGTLQTSLQNTH